MKKTILSIFATIFVVAFINAQDLFTSILDGDLEAVKSIISNGVDVNTPNAQSGQNALAYAYFFPAITEYLLEQGCDPNGGKYPALVSAASVASYEVMKLLLDNGADPNKKGGNETALFKVVQMTNCADCAYLLISKGADINTTGGIYANLLGVFGSYGLNQKERKEFMANYGIGLKKWGVTAAEWYMNPPEQLNAPPNTMVKILVDSGVDINARGKNLLNPNDPGEPPIFTAMNVGKPEVILALLNNGADVNSTYKVIEKGITMWDVEGGYSPLMYACVKGQKDVVAWLVKQPDLKTTTVSGLTTNANKKNILRIEGLSAIYLAIAAGDPDIVKMIASASLTWEDLVIKLMPGQKFKSNYGSKNEKYIFVGRKKGSLKYNPSAFADFQEKKEIAEYLRNLGL